MRLSANPNSHTGYLAEKVLASVEMSLGDFEIVDLAPSVELEAFDTGALDLAFAAEPWLTRLLMGGHAVLWISTQEAAPGEQQGLIRFGPSLIEENPDAGRRFMAAYLMGARAYNRGKTARNLEILAGATGLERDLLTRACWQTLRNDGQINVDSVLDFQAWALKEGLLDTVLPGEAFWDPSFVEHANEVLGTGGQ